MDDDIYWCTADPGWVTGTSYGIIAPWALGVTQCVLEAGFSAEAWYRCIQKYKVTVWYSAPTAIRSLMKAGDDIVKQFDLSSLRHLISVGEPLNPEEVIWSAKVFGLPFYDSYWQTETGSIMISNYPGMKETEAVIKAIEGMPFDGLRQKFSVRALDHMATVACYQGTVAKDPNYPFKVWKDVSRIPGEEVIRPEARCAKSGRKPVS